MVFEWIGIDGDFLLMATFKNNSTRIGKKWITQYRMPQMMKIVMCFQIQDFIFQTHYRGASVFFHREVNRLNAPKLWNTDVWMLILISGMIGFRWSCIEWHPSLLINHAFNSGCSSGNLKSIRRSPPHVTLTSLSCNMSSSLTPKQYKSSVWIWYTTMTMSTRAQPTEKSSVPWLRECLSIWLWRSRNTTAPLYLVLW